MRYYLIWFKYLLSSLAPTSLSLGQSMHLFCPSPKPSARVIFQRERLHLFVQFHMPCNSLLASPMSEKLRWRLCYELFSGTLTCKSLVVDEALEGLFETQQGQLKIMLSSDIMKSSVALYRKPCDSGVTRSIVSGRTGKDWLKIKRNEPGHFRSRLHLTS